MQLVEIIDLCLFTSAKAILDLLKWYYSINSDGWKTFSLALQICLNWKYDFDSLSFCVAIYKTESESLCLLLKGMIKIVSSFFIKFDCRYII